MITVLVVDDDVKKLKAISAALVDMGVDVGSIQNAQDAAEARRALNYRSFDIMLLDVMLPARKHAMPSGENSVDLLRQMVEEKTLRAPPHILGITADETALNHHAEEFRTLTTQVLRVDPAADEWKRSLRIVVDKCLQAGSRQDYDYDLCIQTALRTPEYQAAIDVWPADWSDEVTLSRGVLFRSGWIELGGRRLKVACAHATGMGLVASTDLSGKLIRNLRPRILAMTGICGGIGVSIGDLVVAEKAWDWQSGKYDGDGVFQSGVDQKDASPELLAHARSIEDEMHNLDTAWRGSKPVNRGKIHVAPMVSGSSVVADSAMHAALKSQHRKVAAIDMEAYGMYFSAHMADSPVPKMICIKGVSDLADSDKNDWAQDYCSHISAAFLMRLVARYYRAV